jgi:hypothetical protein
VATLPPTFWPLSKKVIYAVGYTLGRWYPIERAVMPVPMMAILGAIMDLRVWNELVRKDR